MRVPDAADAPAGPCSLPPPWLTWCQARKRWPAPRPPAGCERRPGKPRRDQGRTEDRGPAAAVGPRHPAAREDPVADAVRDRGPRCGDPRDRRAGPRPGQPPGAHPVQRRRDPMGVPGHRHCPPAPALAAPARRRFSYERTAVPVRTQTRPRPPASSTWPCRPRSTAPPPRAAATSR